MCGWLALIGVIILAITIVAYWINTNWQSFVTVLGLAIAFGWLYFYSKSKEDEKKRKEEGILREKQLAFEKEQRAQGLVKYNDKWGTPKQVKRWKEIDVGIDNNFAHLSPYQFEEFIAELFREMGYKATKTPDSGDFGADVIAEKGSKTILIECKQYAEGNNVTPREVQRALGAMWTHKADKVVFITTSDYTVRALDLETEAPIELWNKRILHRMVRKYFIDKENKSGTKKDSKKKPNGKQGSSYVWLEDAQKYRCEYCLEIGKYHYCKTLNGIKRHIERNHE